MSYLFIDVISNLGKLLKLECDIKLALLLRWLVGRVFTRCSYVQYLIYFLSVSGRLTYKLQKVFDVALPENEAEMVAS